MGWKKEYNANEAKNLGWNIYKLDDDTPWIWWYSGHPNWPYVVGGGDDARDFHTLRQAKNYAETTGREVLAKEREENRKRRERDELSKIFLNNK